MQNTTTNKLKLGIFVSIGIALFIAGIYLIGQRQQLFSSTFHINGIFKDISGLQVGNNVRFSGINVGIVDAIDLISDSTVRVDMVIDENTRKFIKKDSRAIIGSDGLMGSKIVVIVSGKTSKEAVTDNHTIATSQPVNMEEILADLKTTSENAAIITSDFAAITGNIRAGKGTIGKLLMDSSMARTVDRALNNIKQGAGGFKQNMDAAKSNILLKGYYNKKERQKEKDKEVPKEETPKQEK